MKDKGGLAHDVFNVAASYGGNLNDNNTEKSSDAGGVSARQGFKFQDHVAAGFALQMIRDAELLRVECETADDICLIWLLDGSEVYEYIQVKTTESSSKYSKTELLKRVPSGKNPTSLAEKSLICDKHCDAPLFRFVSKRDVNDYLKPLKLARTLSARSAVDLIAADLAKKYNTKSKKSKGLDYWAKKLLWEVLDGIPVVRDRNLQVLANLADQGGANPTHPHCLSIYDDLLKKVVEAAEASSITHAEKKVISRDQILDWWSGHLKQTSAAALKTSKPYRISTDAFFVELEIDSGKELNPTLVGYDVRFERKVWRATQLASYLATWLPEIALKPSELVGIGHLQLKQKLTDAVKRIENHAHIDLETLLAESLLHSLLRHYHNSEPIACKIFYKSSSGVKSFANSHIIHGKTDELWLGRSELARAANFDDVVDATMEGLSAALDTDFLKAEREAVLTLREPQHLLPTSLESALQKNAPIDDLLAVLCVPILIAYESTVIGCGFSEDYQSKLSQEVMTRYGALTSRIPTNTTEIRISVFFLPIENVDNLITLFAGEIRGT
ncbi:HamA C-terminal domain-containing protein [Loktanella sp. M215]|uniref:HamA C-terminal domain-containing protein n=1 Tax=Loktanella sp. M215 TaxID=2675431 RepID=UPI001F031F16|nr:Hachiman antiphage defense system protein HamA [Loktanella sp. M215]MCF7699224.1 DUF1837 domain-containing protein [Loktanella sp. M215]